MMMSRLIDKNGEFFGDDNDDNVLVRVLVLMAMLQMPIMMRILPMTMMRMLQQEGV